MLSLNLNKEELNIYEYVKTKNKVCIDELAFALQIDASILSLQLLEMEFKGIIRTLPGKFYELV